MQEPNASGTCAIVGALRGVSIRSQQLFGVSVVEGFDGRFVLERLSDLTSCSLHCRKTQLTESVQRVHDMPSPRFIKSHLPYHLLPTQMDTVKPKIIYTSRNPKDLCVSFYCYCQVCKTLHKNYSKSVKPFIKIILAIASWCTSLWAASRSSVSFS